MNFIILVQILFYFKFSFGLIALICDTNVKYYITPVFEGVPKSVFSFLFCVK